MYPGMKRIAERPSTTRNVSLTSKSTTGTRTNAQMITIAMSSGYL